ncbi:MAG: hypothetical protein AB7H97_20485 [Pseudobdellovibrionaceae bacterium]
MKTFFIPFLLLMMSFADAAESGRLKVISAVARKNGGEVVYTEKHEIRMNSDGSLSQARTDYFAPDRTLRAVLETDFKNGLAATDYTFIDKRDGSAHGVVAKPNGYLVWKKNKDGKREEELIEKRDFKDKDLVVAGQGLFFYLRNHLKTFKKGDSIPVKLLFPGRLDYFSFDLTVHEEGSRFVSFRMNANNILLSLFIPSLRFKFDRDSNEIVEYTGPSNLVDDRGGMQKVEISYNPKES